ncbi:HyaD/HybD family hydrogenase maturation endopeptidase [Alkalilimnicola ehrlichii MLHE-1]|uniref:Hydrogenase 1 maturation peptidase HyaD n=1 Tax=Alkalilimnicola ehrlichii (strain ATCC BAA-1101 / DSM 17681 / MLHE-1) TaxID=187272 RepID=Q0A719_ALKEH|nr:HyaD/HybD family hydrogenase maturation endopeptidase [Alkalilimnicola ehrlichii]ABI57368.1 Hydrogenase 1 maturation peptidase HyaD [Alkalilimnicola ehrlichii MLHE-1]
MGQEPDILVLGIGNLLWADEGFGVRAAEALAAEYDLPEDRVRLLDGGTQGLYLLEYVTAAHRLLVFDAVDYALPPGTLKVVRGADVPKFMGAKKMSLHQTGFQEVLATADLLGQLPEALVLIGVQPEELEDYGGSLRASVKARVPEALAIALDCLREWGVSPAPRCRSARPRLNDSALDMARYEADRPDEGAACRYGDPRVLAVRGQA